jgi:PTS system nitrogen regulatory IIA component
MDIMGFLDERAVTTDLKARHSKEEVIRELVQLLVHAGSLKEKDANKIIQTLLKRESLGSTGIGNGVAIPHGKSDCVTRLVGAFGVSRAGVDFDALDGEPVSLVFLLVAPEDSAGPHLKALARISRLLKDKHFRDSLLTAKDEKTLVTIIREEDERRH